MLPLALADEGAMLLLLALADEGAGLLLLALADEGAGLLPLPLAGEGWGEGRPADGPNIVANQNLRRILQNRTARDRQPRRG